MDQYRIERKLGSGTFGSVFLVRSRKDGCMYALKQVRIGEDALNAEVIHPSRESSINQYLVENASSQQQAYFVNMKNQFYTRRVDPITNKTTLWNNMILEYISTSLSSYLSNSPSVNRDIIILSLIQDMHFLHSHRILHRDLKPSNILLDPTHTQLKICDFGSSKQLPPPSFLDNHRSTPLVTSRFYRAPELLMGATFYSFPVDLWSLGCVIAEVLLGHPLFIALDSDGEQLLILGTPSEEDLTQMQVPQANRNSILALPPIHAIPFDSIFPSDISPVHLRIIRGLLQYDPTKRMTIQQVWDEVNQ